MAMKRRHDMGLMITIGIIVLLAFWLASMYNSLVRLRNQVKNSWSQIEVQLKRRHDLIPNLVETAKGYIKHERETLEAITNARSKAVEASGVAEQGKAESQLSEALSRFLLIVENYPDLKASHNFLALQEELTSTENKVGFARQFYNDQVMKYNTKIESVPANIIANMFNFEKSEFFEVELPKEREVPKVKF
jgi:LemA protein